MICRTNKFQLAIMQSTQVKILLLAVIMYKIEEGVEGRFTNLPLKIPRNLGSFCHSASLINC